MMADDRPPPRTSMLSALFPRYFTQWLGPLLAGGGLALVIAVLTVASGLPDLAASTPHPEGWASLLHYTFRRSISHHADVPPPPAFAAEPVVKGAIYFSRVCASCHGAPGLGQNPVALGMRPRPQYLVKDVASYTPAELFQIVKHGVKYSAMPSWPVQDRDDEVWSVVAFLKVLPAISPKVYRTIVEPPGGPPSLAGADAAPARPFALAREENAAIYPLNAARPSTGFGRATLAGSPAAACGACHGSDGAGHPGSIPNLTLLDPRTVRTALAAYAAGTRHSGYMQSVASQLSDPQLEAMTAWVAGLPRRPSPAAPADPAAQARGAAIATGGVASRRIPACDSCHAINRANAAAYPAIAGQNYWYLRDQLTLFRNGQRGTDTVGNVMVGAARGLNDGEIAALAQHYAALAPAAPAPVPEGRRQPPPGA